VWALVEVGLALAWGWAEGELVSASGEAESALVLALVEAGLVSAWGSV
jgi:hypothetical protein